MKLKQLLCLGALMTLPMSMSANITKQAWLKDLKKMKATQPGSALCVTNYYVESPLLFYSDQKDKLYNSLSSALNRLQGKKTVSIKIARAYPHPEPVFVIEHTFNSTHNSMDCLTLQDGFQKIIKSTIAKLGFDSTDVHWHTREIIFEDVTNNYP